MNPEGRTCQNCKNQFTIEADDFSAYEQFGVQPPRWCVMCRAQRRLAFRNERSFYKRTCNKCGKEKVSMYSPNKPYPVWCNECWFADDWDAAQYAKEYDPSRPFLDQFKELWDAVPKVGLIHIRSVNSEYLNISADNKNCYMIVESSNNEDCSHCYWIQVCRNSVDISFSHQTEFSYESDDCYNSNKLFYSKGCHDCLESYFLLDCRGCSNSIGCVNLRNKQYCVFNKQLTKEEYFKFLESAQLDTASGVEKLRKDFNVFADSQIRKYAEIYNAPGSSGNYISNAKNCRHCFHAYDAEDNAYSVHVWRGAKGCMDCDTSGRGAEYNYNSLNAGVGASRCTVTSVCWGSTFAEYSFYCHTSNNVFGSVGLRNKNFCILNKQYSKDEYMALREKIIEEMRANNAYGEFFPLSISPFGYNESSAQGQFPLTKEEAGKQGFAWEDYPRGTYGKETIPWSTVPDSINDLGSLEPAKEIFACTNCMKNYRIIPHEVAFYKQLAIPLPRWCPDCRHERRFAARGPNWLWNRTCECKGSAAVRGAYQNTVPHFHGESSCPNEFQASYSADRPEIIYCEQCYQAEVV